MGRAGRVGRVGRVKILVGLLMSVAACRQAPLPPPLTAQVSGTLSVVGLAAPVRVVRDRWGVPHIFAESRDDVFFAQGFVQAQDRLFQMELWRRASEGRLAEVLGANFIERDAMTRRLQYQGDREVEWASYPAGTREVAEAFVRGVNAWVALARERRPELFAVAGWPAVFWSAEDLLTRTDAFDREATIAAAERQGLPAVVVNAIRRAAAPAFFTGLARAPRSPSGHATPWAPVDADSVQYPAPSPRYLVHLHTAGWNAIGASVPWRPGIVFGHDGNTTFDQPDERIGAIVRVDRLQPSAGRVVNDVIAVKGRTEPFISTSQITSRGVVVATDRENGGQYVLDWPGHQAGTSPAFARINPGELRRGKPGFARLDPGELRRGVAGPTRPPFDQPTRPLEPTRPVLFHHPLAVSSPARWRFDVGPFTPPANGTAPFFVQADRNVWDASRAMSAPGQSEDPESPHHADLAVLWAAGQTLTLAFTDAAVAANAETTLTLVPAPRR